MKFIFALIVLIFVQNCSFDNKTGIWENENKIKKSDNLFKDFEALTSSNKIFDTIIPIKKEFKFKISKPINNFKWHDIFYDETNNLKNFKYNDLNQLIYKSKKVTKHNINDSVLFDNNHVITSDNKGNIIVFSINQNKILVKFNFYKKKYKKIKKQLNLIVKNNIIYVSDNIGFLYAYNYKFNKIIWAKDYKIPFRSNLKIAGNKLITSNQNNGLYLIDVQTGDLLKLIPTEETTVKNEFINNLSLNKNSVIFLNTYGSLYSIDNTKMNIKWFLNLNQSTDINPSSLFLGSQVIAHEDTIVVSSNKFTYIIDANTGSLIFKKNFSSKIKPIIIKNYLFLITKKNLLISMNLDNGKIIYSYNVNQLIAKFLNTKKKEIDLLNIMLVNNNIYIFLKNAYLLKLNIRGQVLDVKKLPNKINTYPIVIDGSLLFFNKKNKIIIVN